MGKVQDLKFTQEDKQRAYVKFFCVNSEELVEVIKEKGVELVKEGKGFKVQVKEQE